jgi:OmpA-OmpF porin, OOP family
MSQDSATARTRRLVTTVAVGALFLVAASAAPSAVTQGTKARIQIGPVATSAGQCTYEMAEAIGNMLATALVNTGRFIVVTSQEAHGSPHDLEVKTTITKFEPEAGGGGALSGLKRSAMARVGVKSQTAELTMDMKLVDVASGRILKARPIQAKSTNWGTDVSFGGSVRDIDLDTALSTFSNAPMEKAVRAGLAEAVGWISKETPKESYRFTGEEPLGEGAGGAAAEAAGGGAGDPAAGQAGAAPGDVAEDMTLFTNYDFVPGSKVIFYDDMKNEEVGEFPFRWKLDSGVYEVVRLGQEFWIMATADGSIRPKVADAPLPPRYTVEFEFTNNGPEFSGNYFYLYWVDAKGQNIGETGVYGNDKTWLSILSQSLADKTLSRKLTKGIHTFRVMATARSIKCYVDEERIANVPQVEGFRPVGFRLRHRPYRDPKNPTLFRGFRFAEGGKTMREQLAETGRIVTHGILFDVNSARIKGESYRTLQEIGQLLQDMPDLRLSIEGHTDSDGSDESNMTLSQRRADSVRTYLISTFNIAADRLESKGWGESKPVDTNETAEGKANNRRVELVKL